MTTRRSYTTTDELLDAIDSIEVTLTLLNRTNVLPRSSAGVPQDLSKLFGRAIGASLNIR